MTNDKKRVVWQARSDPFGTAALGRANTRTSHLRLPGQYYDDETGLHYNWHRYYDPGIGRYLRVDPLFQNQPLGNGTPHVMQFRQQDPLDLSPYIYAKNNPIVRTDRTGLLAYNGGGLGFEGHYILGGGLDQYVCCDGKNIWLISTIKLCFGAGFAVSSGAVGSMISEANCPDGYEGLSVEFGLGPLELNVGFSPGEAILSLGLSHGGPGKATLCHNSILYKSILSCCN